MRGVDWTAYVAPIKVEELPEPEKRDGVEVKALRTRTSPGLSVGLLIMTC